MQLNPLTVKDPLKSKEIIINIQVTADDKPRDQRLVLVSAGISGKAPIMLSGSLADISTLINQAWHDLGLSLSPGVTPSASGTTIAKVNIKPTKKAKQSKPNKESILSLF